MGEGYIGASAPGDPVLQVEEKPGPNPIIQTLQGKQLWTTPTRCQPLPRALDRCRHTESSEVPMMCVHGFPIYRGHGGLETKSPKAPQLVSSAAGILKERTGQTRGPTWTNRMRL